MQIEQHITIPPIKLVWTEWYSWETLLKDARTDKNAARLPDKPGVYEVKYVDQEKRLTIGKASSLRMRVKQALVKGKIPHSSGERIRAEEDLAQIVIRWAETARPAAVEEELHRQYFDLYGALPKHTRRT